jgi:hypothetical protein
MAAVPHVDRMRLVCSTETILYNPVLVGFHLVEELDSEVGRSRW